MSKAGERLIRSAQQALAYARGEEDEETRCVVIPPDMPKAERIKLIQELLDQEVEEVDGEDLVRTTAGSDQPAKSAGPAPRSPQRRVAASGRSR